MRTTYSHSLSGLGEAQAEEKKFTIEKIASLVSKVAPLIQSIFSGKKAKEALAQKGQYDQANSVLRNEISTLNASINDLTQQTNTIALQLKAKGVNGFDGFESYSGIDGILDFLRSRKVAEKKLNTAKETYETLSRDRDLKLTTVANMLDQLDALKKRLESSSGNGIMIALGIAVVGYFAISQSSEKP